MKDKLSLPLYRLSSAIHLGMCRAEMKRRAKQTQSRKGIIRPLLSCTEYRMQQSNACVRIVNCKMIVR